MTPDGPGGADDFDDIDDDDLDDGYDDDYDDDDDLDVDEVAAEGNRVVGARAMAVAEHVVRNVVEDADAVEIEVSEQRGEVMLLVRAAPDDMGRLIGRRGRVIQAIRQVVRAAGSSEGVRAGIDVMD
ncbi:MAG: KH domain-containing protein [Acidimicrobiia bacterium]|nr:KH domain-containing protein [Acidimicrobiia bacterium]